MWSKFKIIWTIDGNSIDWDYAKRSEQGILSVKVFGKDPWDFILCKWSLATVMSGHIDSICPIVELIKEELRGTQILLASWALVCTLKCNEGHKRTKLRST